MITIIGTAHISRESVEEVRKRILEVKPDVVAVELCQARYLGLVEQKTTPIFDLLRSKNSFLLIANVLLSFLQRRLGDEVGVKPGKDMLVALDTAKELKADYALIDRDIRITLKRAIANMGFLEKLSLIKEMIFSFEISKGEIEKEIDEIKKEGHIEDILEKFKKISPNMFKTLVDERDAFMAHNLLTLEKKYKNVVAVVGAGHKKGVERYLSHPNELPDKHSLMVVPEKRLSITKVLKYGIPALIITMFAISLHRGIPIKDPIKWWFLNHYIPTFIGVMVAGGSVISAVVGMLASPLTSLNPMVAAGWFAGATEMKVRKVTLEDVSEMFKIAGYREMYRNKAFKVILVTALANIGSMIGTFISFPTVVFPLLKNIFS